MPLTEENSLRCMRNRMDLTRETLKIGTINLERIFCPPRGRTGCCSITREVCRRLWWIFFRTLDWSLANWSEEFDGLMRIIEGSFSSIMQNKMTSTRTIQSIGTRTQKNGSDSLRVPEKWLPITNLTFVMLCWTSFQILACIKRLFFKGDFHRARESLVPSLPTHDRFLWFNFLKVQILCLVLDE